MRPQDLRVLGPAPPIEAAARLNGDAPIALDDLEPDVALGTLLADPRQ